MVKQGDIIKINFDPQAGHEQAGYRPALVISNNFFNNVTNLTIVCPITNSADNFPLHISLDKRTQTTGIILCEYIKVLDLSEMGYKSVEKIPDDILKQVINVVFSEVEYKCLETQRN